MAYKAFWEFLTMKGYSRRELVAYLEEGSVPKQLISGWRLTMLAGGWDKKLVTDHYSTRTKMWLVIVLYALSHAGLLIFLLARAQILVLGSQYDSELVATCSLATFTTFGVPALTVGIFLLAESLKLAYQRRTPGFILHDLKALRVALGHRLSGLLVHRKNLPALAHTYVHKQAKIYHDAVIHGTTSKQEAASYEEARRLMCNFCLVPSTADLEYFMRPEPPQPRILPGDDGE